MSVTFSIHFSAQQPNTYHSQVGVIQGVENRLNKPDFHVHTSILKRLARHFRAKVDIVRYAFHLCSSKVSDTLFPDGMTNTHSCSRLGVGTQDGLDALGLLPELHHTLGVLTYADTMLILKLLD